MHETSSSGFAASRMHFPSDGRALPFLMVNVHDAHFIEGVLPSRSGPLDGTPLEEKDTDALSIRRPGAAISHGRRSWCPFY
jgi:hypothetical protein